MFAVKQNFVWPHFLFAITHIYLFWRFYCYATCLFFQEKTLFLHIRKLTIPKNNIIMPIKNKLTVPHNYPVCLHHDCSMAASCLHHIAFDNLIKQEEFLRLISPNKCTKDAECPYYRCSNPVRYARGFTGFQKQMFPQQYEQFMTTLVMHFGRNQYFARRRGEIILPPEEQQIIRTLLQQIGANPSMDFDNYEELICWNV